jgi:hypothetical protein
MVSYGRSWLDTIGSSSAERPSVGLSQRGPTRAHLLIRLIQFPGHAQSKKSSTFVKGKSGDEPPTRLMTRSVTCEARRRQRYLSASPKMSGTMWCRGDVEEDNDEFAARCGAKERSIFLAIVRE